MESMFGRARRFNSDLSKWQVRNVRVMAGMFCDAESFDSDLSQWQVGNVDSMDAMFRGAKSFNQDLSKWQVQRVSSMESMFKGAKNFNGNLSKWQVGKVKRMINMFAYATSFNQDLSKWQVGDVSTMFRMFTGADNFAQDLSKWQVGKVESMGSMFKGAKRFTSDLSEWQVGKVKNMEAMFMDASSFTSDLSKWHVETVRKMNRMFKQAKTFNSDVSKWQVKNVNEMCEAFKDASKFTSDLSKWQVGRVTTMQEMFSGASKFNSDHSKWQVGQAADVTNMFGSALGLKWEQIGWWTSDAYPPLDGTEVFNTGLAKALQSTTTFMNLTLATFKVKGLLPHSCILVTDPRTPLDEAYFQPIRNASLSYCQKSSIRSSWPRRWSKSTTPTGWSTIIEAWTDDIKLCVLTDQNIMEAVNAWLFDRAQAQKAYGAIADWDVSRITIMDKLFCAMCSSRSDQYAGQIQKGAAAFDEDLSRWNVSGVVSAHMMFKGAKSFNQDISKWDVRNMKDMQAMFSGATSFVGTNVSEWEVASANNTSQMFRDAVSFAEDISGWPVGSLAKMRDMFDNVGLSDCQKVSILNSWPKKWRFGEPPSWADLKRAWANAPRRCDAKECGQDKVLTDSYQCAELEILASVQSKSKHVIIKKANPHLKVEFTNPSVAVEVGPAEDYPVNLQHRIVPDQVIPWVNFSGLRNTTTSTYLRKGTFEFSAASLRDGTKLAATLVFDGRAGASETNATISVTALVQSTPSLDKSEIEIPSELMEGQSAQMSIYARDVDGIPITDGRGRFIALAWRGPGDTESRIKKMVFDSSRQRFECDFTSLELSQVGEYRCDLFNPS